MAALRRDVALVIDMRQVAQLRQDRRPCGGRHLDQLAEGLGEDAMRLLGVPVLANLLGIGQQADVQIRHGENCQQVGVGRRRGRGARRLQIGKPLLDRRHPFERVGLPLGNVEADGGALVFQPSAAHDIGGKFEALHRLLDALPPLLLLAGPLQQRLGRLKGDAHGVGDLLSRQPAIS